MQPNPEFFHHSRRACLWQGSRQPSDQRAMRVAAHGLTAIANAGLLCARAVLALDLPGHWRPGQRMRQYLSSLKRTLAVAARGRWNAVSRASRTDKAVVIAREFDPGLAMSAERAATLDLGEEKCQSLLQSLPVAVVVHGPDATILTSNCVAQELLGLSESQLLGRAAVDPAWPLFREDGTIMPVDEYPANQVFATGQPLRNFVFGVHRPGQGDDAWLLVNAQPVAGVRGEIARVIVAFVDVSERKRERKALQDSEERFRDLYENAPIAYFSGGFDDLLLRCNWRAEELLGYPSKDLIGHPIVELYADTVHGRIKAAQLLQRFRRGEMVRGEELQMRRADGRLVWISLTVNAAKDSEGRIVESRSMVVDITERKRAEEVLQISEGRYRMAQAVGHVGNWEYNLATAKFWGSEEAKRIYGFDSGTKEFSTEEVEKCIPERERVHQALVDLIETGKPYDLEFEIHPRHSSEPRVIASVAELKRDERGAPRMVVGVIQDITARKRAEETRELNQELERALEILRSALAERDARLEGARCREKLLHDMANAASRLSLSAQVLCRILQRHSATLTGEVRGQLEREAELLGRAASHFGQLQQQRGARSRDLAPKPEPLPLGELLNTAAALSGIPGDGLRLSIDAPSWVCPRADRLGVTRVLVNLLTNARQAIENGREESGEVHAVARDEGTRVVIEVSDTGPGVPAELRERVFEEFFTTRTATGGTGLGLSAAREFARACGGDLELPEPQPARGALLRLTLPSAKDSHMAGIAANHSQSVVP
jgi:PAS domain S-box-containing protein